MSDIEKKLEREKLIIKKMISLYCNHVHRTKNLCLDCKTLLDYCEKKIDKCPFMDTKTFCSECSVHCYNKDMREQIRTVMRYSGPRIIFYHPILAIKHVYYSKIKK